jgi:hypothetical protein
MDTVNYVTNKRKVRTAATGPVAKQHSRQTAVSTLHNKEKHESNKNKNKNPMNNRVFLRKVVEVTDCNKRFK